MIYGVCLVCGGNQCRCGLSLAKTRIPRSGLREACGKHVSSNDIVVGDPTNFKSADVDYGWDIESEGALIDNSALISR